MKKLQCELCGSIDIVKTANDLFECQHCGCKYTKDQAMALIHGTVEVYSGNIECQRKLKAAKSLLDLSDYSNAFISFENLTKEYAYEPDVWKEFCLAALTWIRRTKTIETHIQINQKPIHRVCLKDLYDSALQVANHDTDLQMQWSSFWEDAAQKLEQGEYLLNFDLYSYGEAIPSVASFHPAMKAAMEKALANAAVLNNHNIHYIPSWLDERTPVWLPCNGTKITNYAFGRQMFTTTVFLLDVPVSCTDGALIGYQTQSSENARKCFEQNICPYCGGALQSKMFAKDKECRACGKIKRP